MKKFYFLSMVVASAIMVTSCKSEKKEEVVKEEVVQTPAPSAVVDTASIVAKVAIPTFKNPEVTQ